jgi:hypothetical protein
LSTLWLPDGTEFRLLSLVASFRKEKTKAVVSIISGALLLVLILGAVIAILCLPKRQKESVIPPSNQPIRAETPNELPPTSADIVYIGIKVDSPLLPEGIPIYPSLKIRLVTKIGKFDYADRMKQRN